MNAEQIVKALHWLGDVLDRQPTDYPAGGGTCYAAADLIESLQAQLDQQQSNELLTLDELREMEGQPVWVDTMQEWRIVFIGVEKDVRLYSIRNTVSAKHVFNNDGRIYRRKPERSEDNGKVDRDV